MYLSEMAPQVFVRTEEDGAIRMRALKMGRIRSGPDILPRPGCIPKYVVARRLGPGTAASAHLREGQSGPGGPDSISHRQWHCERRLEYSEMALVGCQCGSGSVLETMYEAGAGVPTSCGGYERDDYGANRSAHEPHVRLGIHRI